MYTSGGNMKILSVGIANEKTFNVLFEENGTVLCDQCYDTTDIQRFSFSEVTALVASDPTIIDRPLPAPELTVDMKTSFKQQCEDWLPIRRHEGFMFGDIPCPADAEAQANFSSVLNLIQLGAPGPFLLHDNNNVDHMLTIAEVQSLCVQMATFVQGAYQACWTAKASIDASTTVEECEAAIASLRAF